MTLILSFLSRDHVIQVSDRRLSRPRGSTCEVCDDESNKAVVAHNLVAFAYTGLAEVSAETHTDIWLWDRLREAGAQNISATLRHVADSATLEFAKLRVRREQLRHAFVAVGWGRTGGDSGFMPFYATASNALDDSGTRWLPTARDQFRASSAMVLPASTPWHVVSHGQSLSDIDRAALHRNIKSCARSNGLQPAAVIRAIANCIRDVARKNPTVGRSLMAISLPRCEAGLAEGMICPMTSRVPADKAVAMYLPDNIDTRNWYMPHYVGSAGSMSELVIEVGPEEPRWWQPRY